MTSALPRHGNFDLIRLAAALQVFYFHACVQLGLQPGALHSKAATILQMFPGVPVFFVISGFLLYFSLCSNSSVPNFYRNRALRIYPALWITFGLSLAFVWCVGPFEGFLPGTASFTWWSVSHITGFFLFAPNCFGVYGPELLNGSLWAVPVLLQFYLIMPVLVRLAQLDSKIWRGSVLLIVAGVASSILWDFFVSHVQTSVGQFWAVKATVVMNFYPLVLGVVLAANYNAIRKAVEGKAIYWVLACIVFQWTGRSVAGRQHWDSTLSAVVVHQLLLALAVISCAVTGRGLAQRILRGCDLSYGIFLVHLLVVHVLTRLGCTGEWKYFWVALASTATLAALSWFFVEKPFLRMKTGSLRADTDRPRCPG